MKIALLADEEQQKELRGIEWIHCSNEETFFGCEEADIYINLLNDASEKNYNIISKPVIISSVINTLYKMNHARNVVRINGWPGFLSRTDWELAGEMNDALTQFFISIKKNIVITPDEPGFIAARIIAMIINESYYALSENLSTHAEIDIALKLGTNYPYGPFEWCNKIGRKNIFNLLLQLEQKDKRYSPAPALQQSI